MAFLQGNRTPIAGHKMSVYDTQCLIALEWIGKTLPQSIKAVVISFSKTTAQSRRRISDGADLGPVYDSIRSDRSWTKADDIFPGAKPIPLLSQEH